MRCLYYLAGIPILLGLSSVVSAQAPSLGSCPVLPADNIWNTPIDQLPVSPNSSTYVNTIGPGVGVHPDFGSGSWAGEDIGMPYVTVPATQIKYPVSFFYPTESDPGPYAVPLNAPIQGGSASTGDRHVISIDVDHCILYEMYAAYPQAASWQAVSGAIYNLLSNNLRVASWTSATAAGLPMFPGLVRYDEILAGEIRHALEFTVPQTQQAYVWPARHFASPLTGAQYPPMGVRFRLRANFDISGFSPTNQIILRALKKYGMMIIDNGAQWFISGTHDARWDNADLHNLGAVHGSDFEVVDVSGLMIAPDSGQARQSTTVNVTVTVTPASALVRINRTRAFTATVQNTSNTAVTWKVNGITGGNSTVGFISSLGTYKAPSAVPPGAVVTVSAVSVSDPTKSADALVTVVRR
ncbi:MAG: putative outerrane protein (modular protein) [Bryobacterales bacterium]|nr:putative outerrane protein (modular protein) [Bryobacterales bacterium]